MGELRAEHYAEKEELHKQLTNAMFGIFKNLQIQFTGPEKVG